ncbi:hypothetical protein GCM10027024_13680 [Microbacterium insulae]
MQIAGELPGARRDHQGLVALRSQMAEHMEDRPRDPVHVGQERFGEECDSHGSSVVALGGDGCLDPAAFRESSPDAPTPVTGRAPFRRRSPAAGTTEVCSTIC